MRVGRHEIQHFNDFRWQCSSGCQFAANGSELGHRRQFATQQQPHDFFETRVRGEIVNVIAAIEQSRVRIDPADGSFAGNHAFEARTIGRFGFAWHIGPITSYASASLFPTRIIPKQVIELFARLHSFEPSALRAIAL